ncbi:hypothetical protein ACJMK2_005373 [Sinanodonta woodiana]|uniref:Heparanase n=1 Tax=Sinanodonta woodiana TaxID=1069815 RepID=A0ABD3VSU3_SINWO
MKSLHSVYWSCKTVLAFVSFLTKIDADISVKLKIDGKSEINRLNADFVGVTLDTSLLSHHWGKLDVRSKAVQTLAKGLAPCFVRVGGTGSDFLIFKNGKSISSSSRTANDTLGYGKDLSKGIDYINHLTNFTMTGEFFDSLYSFVQSVGWNMTFDLNVLLRERESWDPENAIQLMKYIAKKNYRISGWELGNEPDAFYHILGYRIKASQLADDYKRLYQILHDTFPQFNNNLILGPSVTKLCKEKPIDYFTQFLKSGGGKIVTAATFHHYYISAKSATEKMFLDPKVLDSLIKEVQSALTITRKWAPDTRVWLGETSSASGGGAKGLSDTYIAGFMWLDKLGVAAKYGVDVVLRQSFYSGHYSLLDHNDCSPNPDYWLTLLYKNLVGRTVLNVTSSDASRHLRVYAHCTNIKRTQYKPGSVTIYLMNLHKKETVKVEILNFLSENVDFYLLQPVPSTNVKSKYISLNGKTLSLQNNELPPLLPRKQQGEIILPSLTYGFIVIPNANAAVCY